jgi:hypothetical protein
MSSASSSSFQAEAEFFFGGDELPPWFFEPASAAIRAAKLGEDGEDAVAVDCCMAWRIALGRRQV